MDLPTVNIEYEEYFPILNKSYVKLSVNQLGISGDKSRLMEYKKRDFCHMVAQKMYEMGVVNTTDVKQNPDGSISFGFEAYIYNKDGDKYSSNDSLEIGL